MDNIFIRIGNFGGHISRVKAIGQCGNDIDSPYEFSSANSTSLMKGQCSNKPSRLLYWYSQSHHEAVSM